MKRLLAALLAAVPAAVAAQEPRPFPWELRASGARESIDHGLADWREAVAQISHRPIAHQSIFAGFRATERFGQRDREIYAGAYLPLSGMSTVLHVEGARSSTHRVLPRHFYLAEIVQPLGGGWVVSAGGKSSRYTYSDAYAAWTTVERYLGEFRYAYQVQIGRGAGGNWSPSHRLTASWYRGDLTFLTASASRGREVENLFPAGLLESDVRAASLEAGLEIERRWGLVMELGWTRQGDFYTRRTLRLGTRALF